MPRDHTPLVHLHLLIIAPSHIRNMSTTLSCPMPAIDIAHQHLLTARSLHEARVAAGTARFETLDWSSIVIGSRVAAGLDALDIERVSPPRFPMLRV
jgi:hypothetical protein